LDPIGALLDPPIRQERFERGWVEGILSGLPARRRRLCVAALFRDDLRFPVTGDLYAITPIWLLAGASGTVGALLSYVLMWLLTLGSSILR
jgi:hypothetical protein